MPVPNIFANQPGPIPLSELDANFSAFASSSGSSLVGFQQAGAGSVVRTSQSKLQESVSVMDFGAAGDGVSNDTSAFTACLAYCQLAGKDVYVPAGAYSVDEINYGHPSGAAFSPSIRGSGKQTTFLNKRSSDGNSVLVVNSASSGGFTTLDIRDLSIRGISGNTPSGVSLTACTVCNIVNVLVSECTWGFTDLGGVTNLYDRCEANSNVHGFHFDIAPSPSSSTPNNITLTKCTAGSNTDIGIYFNNGSNLVVDHCDVESNGSGLGAGAGGIVIGPNVVSGSVAASIEGTWLEANSVHVLWFQSGFSSVRRSVIVANAASTNDLNVDGGTYLLDGVVFSTTKPVNILEGVSVSSGNAIMNCTVPALSINSSKTMVWGANQASMRGAQVPVVSSLTHPLIQSGLATCNASGVANVTFGTAFGAVPNLACIVTGSNNAGIVVSIQTSGLSTTGFNIQTSFYNGTAIGTSALSVSWVAVGQGV